MLMNALQGKAVPLEFNLKHQQGMARELPIGVSSGKTPLLRKVIALTAEEEDAIDAVVSGTFPSPHGSVIVLFDFGATIPSCRIIVAC